MSRDKYWDLFEKSGLVTAYLMYKAKRPGDEGEKDDLQGSGIGDS